MQWYTGGIVEAITASKTKGAIFVVYIEGKDDQSQKITSLIDNEELSKKLESQHFVAIKVEAGSVPHQQFSEIYKGTSVPSIYFIGKNGAPLDIITEANDVQSLSQRIESILEKTGVSPATVSHGDPSQSFIQNEQSTSQSNIVCNDGVCTINRNAASTSSNEEVSPEQKVERAKELIQKKREEKEKEEREKEIEGEKERRKAGQSVQQLKKWQEDQELKQLLESRERERRENKLARERVLAQIAQDKAERQAKSSSKPSSPDAAKPQIPSPTKPNLNTTRLQFKLPDGTSGTKEFDISDTLQTVVTYIKESMNLPFSNFRLSTTFPRREFTTEDYSQSLLDLQLIPNAVILVLPVSRGAVATNQGGTFTSMIWSLFTPVFQILGYIRSFIFGSGASAKAAPDKKKSAEEQPSRSDQPRLRPRDSTVIRRQGNVHRLGDRRDSDDEGNTWNGNSTQQM